MHTSRQAGSAGEIGPVDAVDARLLSAAEERELLRGLADCKRKLADALAMMPGAEAAGGDEGPRALAHHIAEVYTGDPPAEARLGAVYLRYGELRGKLALANTRLVAHVAKRFRDRGVAYPDLLQEGFCGLLEAIDRFDLTHETKLATYATWWIRQAMQRAVAAGAYPVRLNPRHLRQLALSQDELDGLPATGARRPAAPAEPAPELIRRIHAATRPTVSLDAAFDAESTFSLLQTMGGPDGDPTDAMDRQEAVAGLMQNLRPREQEILALRFGLGGAARLSLSQVGKRLGVSKERIRQLQDRALVKLRAAAGERRAGDPSPTGV